MLASKLTINEGPQQQSIFQQRLEMAKSNGALPQQTGPMTATWAKREAAAYRTAEQEIGRLPAGEAIVYHEGNLAIDIENDPDVAGRAAAFRAAAEAARGRLAQRRLGFECYQYIFWRSHHDW